jgi:hypothetical protein
MLDDIYGRLFVPLGKEEKSELFLCFFCCELYTLIEWSNMKWVKNIISGSYCILSTFRRETERDGDCTKTIGNKLA